MAHLLAIVSPNPGPIPGRESKALVFMTFSPPEPPESPLPLHAPRGPGYRISVHAAETGRELGRWVSDCSLTVTQNALLWLSMNPWQVEPAQGSMDYMRVMDEVTQHAANPEGAAPRDLVIALSLNFPGSPEVQSQAPGFTGPTGVRLLGGSSPVESTNPMVRQPQVPQFSEPHRGALPLTQIPAKPVRQQPAPARTHGLDGDELDLAKFLARAIRALKRGAEADEIMDAMASLVGPDEDEEGYEEEDGAEIFEDEGQEDVYEDEDEDQEERPGVFLDGSQEPAYRPLRPGEAPSGASLEEVAALEGYAAGDDRLRSKYERTQQRASEQIMHARRVAAANEQSRQLAAERVSVPSVVLAEVPPVVAQQVPPESLHAPELDQSDEVEIPPTNGTNGGGPPRLTKRRLVEAIVSQDPSVDQKSLMKLKRDELIDHLEQMA